MNIHSISLMRDKHIFRKMRTRRRANKLIASLVALAVTVVLFFPILWMLRISIIPREKLFNLPPEWIAKSINLQGYAYFFSQAEFVRYYLNSLIVSASTVALCLFAGTLAAYSFSRFSYRGRRTLMMITLSAQMFPWALLIITLYIFFIKINLLDTYFALVLAHSTFALPLTIWIIKSYFDTIPKELEDAAYIDGSGRLSTLVRIILPLSYPGIIAAAIYVFIFSWNDFLFGLTLTYSPNMRILAPGISLSFIGQFEYKWIEMMACSILVTLPVAIMFVFLQKYFVQGLTAGAVKE